MGADSSKGPDRFALEQLVRSDLRELPPYPGAETAARIRFSPASDTRQRIDAAARGAGASARSGTDDDPIALLTQSQALKESIARSVEIPAEEVLPFASLAALFTVVCSAFARPRDRQPASVMISAPARPLYKWSARTSGAMVVEIPLDADLRAMLPVMGRALATLRPSVVILGSPHDSSGLALEEAELRALLEATRGDALVVVDESFAGPGVSWRHLRRDAPHVAIVRSFEPWLGAGLGLSWLEISPILARALEVFPLVARAEIAPAARAVASVLVNREDEGARLFGRDVDELFRVHRELGQRLAALPKTTVLPGAAPFVAAVCDEPVAERLAFAEREELRGVTGGGVGRLARTLRIAVADREESERVVRWLERGAS